MYDLWLEQAVKDYLFHEVQENVDALNEYIDCLDSKPENMCEKLEEHIFSRLDIYLEESFPLFESILELKLSSGSSDDYDGESLKDTLLTSKKQKQKRRDDVKEFDKKTKGISPIKVLRRKLGVTSLRKKIKDVAKEAWNKSQIKSKLKEKIAAGLKVDYDKILKARKVFKDTLQQYQRAKAKGQEFSALKERMLKARGQYTKLRAGKKFRLRRYAKAKI